ncbi:MAG: hypothetical protein AAFZ15_30555 [Bacteroidota bacterium]
MIICQNLIGQTQLTVSWETNIYEKPSAKPNTLGVIEKNGKVEAKFFSEEFSFFLIQQGEINGWIPSSMVRYDDNFYLAKKFTDESKVGQITSEYLNFKKQKEEEKRNAAIKNEEERQAALKKMRQMELKRKEKKRQAAIERKTKIESNSNKSSWKLGDRICSKNNDTGTIEGVMEQWNADKSRLKIKIIGGPTGMYKGENIEKGNMIWVEPQNWYKCIGDENVNYEISRARSNTKNYGSGELVGKSCVFYEYLIYKSGDGILDALVPSTKYQVEYSAVIESELGDNVKMIISEARIIDPSWASANYFKYKKYVKGDAQEKIGKTAVKPKSEIEIK